MIPGENTELVKRLVISEQMAGREDLDACLERMRKEESPLPVSEYLLKEKLINGEQFARLQKLCDEAERESTQVREEEMKLFGKRVLERGLARPDQVEECLRLQGQMADEGRFLNLGEIMIEKGYLKESEVRTLLDEEDKKIMWCAHCFGKYNVLSQWQTGARCPQCHAALIPADDTRGLGVVATIKGKKDIHSPIGTDFGGCRILEVIGRGAMATVYKARHLGLNRLVAVKLLSMSGRSKDIIQRLLAEARAIARLEHPNIVQVYDVGISENTFYIVMQLLKGNTLAARMKEMGSLPLDEAQHIMRGVSRGLGAAHAAGIIHRDVKPANIMLTEDMRARITDFGLAQDEQGPSSDEEGFVIGTPYYMSPEQWLGRRADARSDIYSMGVVAYQMLTGVRPFEGRTIEEVMNLHLKKEPPMAHEVNPTVPEPLSFIVKKMMAKAPKRRYQQATQLLADLKRTQQGEAPKAMLDFVEMIRCEFCETMNAPGDAKCRVCGESLVSHGTELEILPMDNEFACPNCGEFVRKGARACGRCGMAVCLRCRKSLAVHNGLCKDCGGSAPPPRKKKRRR